MAKPIEEIIADVSRTLGRIDAGLAAKETQAGSQTAGKDLEELKVDLESLSIRTKMASRGPAGRARGLRRL
jgi:hypothetical protein